MRFFRPREMSGTTHPAVEWDGMLQRPRFEFVDGMLNTEDPELIQYLKNKGYYFNHPVTGEMVTQDVLDLEAFRHQRREQEAVLADPAPATPAEATPAAPSAASQPEGAGDAPDVVDAPDPNPKPIKTPPKGSKKVPPKGSKKK